MLPARRIGLGAVTTADVASGIGTTQSFLAQNQGASPQSILNAIGSTGQAYAQAGYAYGQAQVSQMSADAQAKWADANSAASTATRIQQGYQAVDAITSGKPITHKVLVHAVAGAMAATGILAPMGAALELGDALAQWLWSFMPRQGFQPFCNNAQVSAKQLANADGVGPIAPGTLASLIVPTLCQIFSDANNCLPVTGSLSGVAYHSNEAIAALVNQWNNQANGLMVDYFVPFVPQSVLIWVGWVGWGAGSCSDSAKGLSTVDRQSLQIIDFEGQHCPAWQMPPPFPIPGQGKWAFQPLKNVPPSVAVPKLENTQLLSAGFAPDAVNMLKWPPGSSVHGPGPWSRIRARAGGPSLTLIAGGLAALPGVLAIMQGKNAKQAYTTLWNRTRRYLHV